MQALAAKSRSDNGPAHAQLSDPRHSAVCWAHQIIVVMTNTAMRDWTVEELLEDTRKVLRRSQEIIQQSERLVKQSRELMHDFGLPRPSSMPQKQALRQLK